MYMKIRAILIGSLILSVFLVACDTDNLTADNSNKKVKDRWYTSAQLISGKQVFSNNCAACHGDKGQSLVDDWKETLADGSFPAPPLNGTAHTWHHSKKILLRTINKGGVSLGGTMPAFKDKLTDKQKDDVIAYVMSLWSDKVYKAWKNRNPS